MARKFHWERMHQSSASGAPYWWAWRASPPLQLRIRRIHRRRCGMGGAGPSERACQAHSLPLFNANHRADADGARVADGVHVAAGRREKCDRASPRTPAHPSQPRSGPARWRVGCARPCIPLRPPCALRASGSPAKPYRSASRCHWEVDLRELRSAGLVDCLARLVLRHGI